MLRSTAFFPLLLLLSVGAACNRPPQATVLEVHGAVTQGGKPLAAGAHLDPAQDLVVGNGRAEIMIARVGTVRCFANTRFSLAQQGSTLRLRLLIGKVWAKVAALRAGQRFEVDTQNATAGVRGTEYIVESDGTATEVRVRGGTVWVTQNKLPDVVREVHQGERCTVRGEAAPSEAAKYATFADDKSWDDFGEILRDAGRNLKHGLHEVFGPP